MTHKFDLVTNVTRFDKKIAPTFVLFARVRPGKMQRSIDWKFFLEQILNMRRQQLEKLKAELEAQLARDLATSQVRNVTF